ncbi:MAG: JAB domain-containing protein [Gemmatimonadota bacterium]
MTGPEAAARLITSFIGRKDREHFVVVHLSTKHRPVAIETISIGCLSSALVHPREVFKSAVLANSDCIVIGHNHPSGELEPSPEDRAVYRQLTEAGKIMGIRVLDFLIVNESKWYSLTQEGVK